MISKSLFVSCLLFLFTISTGLKSRLLTDGAPNGNGAENKCSSKRCCGFRDESLAPQGINCKLLSISECVLNDNICEWDCYTDNTPNSKKRSKKRGKFIKFDAGNGRVRNEPITYTQHNARHYKNGADVISQNKFYEYDIECGDVYEYEFSPEEGEQIFHDINGQTTVTSGTKENEFGGRRLLGYGVINGGVDERTQSTQKNTDPFSLGGLLMADLDTTGGYETCTATLVGSNKVLLTSAHCVYDTKKNQYIGTNLRFYPDATSPADINANNAYYAEVIFVHSNFINHALYDAVDDYAFIRLKKEVPNVSKYGMGYAYVADLGPTTFSTFGYPGDKMNTFGFGTRWYEACNFNNNNNDFYISSSSAGCDIYSGQSGSVIYSTTNNIAIARGTLTGYTPAGDIWATRIDQVELTALGTFLINS